jgi:G protein-coupled receptor 107
MCRSMQQLVVFRHFYIMVVVYIYFTRIVVHILEVSIVDQYSWIAAAAQELATLVFYTLTAIHFQPHPENQYSRLVSDEEIEMGTF